MRSPLRIAPLNRFDLEVPLGVQRKFSPASKALPLAGLLLLVLFFWGSGGDRFMSISNWRTLVQQASVVAIVGFGLTFVIIAGSIDLSIGSVAALAGMVAATVSAKYGAAVGILSGVSIGAACGLCNGFACSIMKVPSFIVTLGMLSAARGVTLIYSQIRPKVVIGYDALGNEPLIYVVLAIAALISVCLLNLTTFGRYSRAIGGDERVSRLSGVPIARTKMAIFGFAGLMSGLGGIVLSARLGVATPNAGIGLELTSIAAVLLGGTPLTGGVGNIWNTIVGALIIQILTNGLVILGIGSEMQLVIQGLVLVLAVFVALERAKIGIIK